MYVGRYPMTGNTKIKMWKQTRNIRWDTMFVYGKTKMHINMWNGAHVELTYVWFGLGWWATHITSNVRDSAKVNTTGISVFSLLSHKKCSRRNIIITFSSVNNSLRIEDQWKMLKSNSLVYRVNFFVHHSNNYICTDSNSDSDSDTDSRSF